MFLFHSASLAICSFKNKLGRGRKKNFLKKITEGYPEIFTGIHTFLSTSGNVALNMSSLNTSLQTQKYMLSACYTLLELSYSKPDSKCTRNHSSLSETRLSVQYRKHRVIIQYS
jgi:hypothetical protein